MTNVNFFLIGQMSRSKDKVPTKDLITRDIHVKYQTLALTIQKLLARLNFKKKIGHTLRSNTQGKKMVPTKRPYHKEYSCEISKL